MNLSDSINMFPHAAQSDFYIDDLIKALHLHGLYVHIIMIVICCGTISIQSNIPQADVCILMTHVKQCNFSIGIL